jgi:5-methylcytosine-specific restriction endonuclease McrA
MVKLDKRMRRKLRRQNPRARRTCFYCEVTFNWDDHRSEFYPTWDHKVPRSKGGENGLNKVMACRSCNQEKGTMSAVEFREYLEVTKGHVGQAQRLTAWRKHCAQAPSALRE